MGLGHPVQAWYDDGTAACCRKLARCAPTSRVIMNGTSNPWLDQRVDITLPGYKPTYVLIQSKLGGSSFGNILLGGGIGAVVDGTNGSSNRQVTSPAGSENAGNRR